MDSPQNQLYQDIGALKAESKAHTEGIRELNDKLDGLRLDIRNISAVAKVDWEKRNVYVDTKFEDFGHRIHVLEERRLVDESSLWTRIKRKFEDNSAALIAGVLVAMFLLALVYIAKNDDIRKFMAVTDLGTHVTVHFLR